MFYLNILIFKIQRFLFKKIISGKNAWQIFNKTGIEGFGTNLIRLYFPIYYNKKQARDSFSPEVKTQISLLFNDAIKHATFINKIPETLKEVTKLQLTEIDKNAPFLDNYYFGVFDAAILGAIMQHFKPSQIVEIGSGISTRYISHFKKAHHLDTKVICIDPFPRAEIENAADTIIRKPLEDVIDQENFNLNSGDIIFMDGSHYVFQGNDTLNFFFKFLPSLPSGVIIHIHDIYLPDDYHQNVAQQLWTEQYILAAMLMSGFKDYEVLYPAYYMSQHNEPTKQYLAAADLQLKGKEFKLRTDHTEGYSFWMRKK